MLKTDKSNKSKSEKLRKLTLIIFRLFVASIILFILFSKIPISEVGAAMGRIDLRYAIAAFVMSFLAHVGTSFRLKKICELQNINFSAFEIFRINISSRFYSLFLPGGNFTGIAIRFFRLSVFKKKYTEAIFAMLYDRIFATITLCAVGVFFWVIELPKEPQSYFKLMIIFIFSLLVILILMTLFKPVAVLSTLIRWFNRFKFVKIQPLIKSTEYQPQLSPSTITTVSMLSCIIHIFGIISYYLICVALGLNLSFISIGWIRSTVILATMIPVSVSGIGLREGSMIILLSIYDVRAEDALAFSFIVFSVTVLGIGIIGGIFEATRQLK